MFDVATSTNADEKKKRGILCVCIKSEREKRKWVANSRSKERSTRCLVLLAHILVHSFQTIDFAQLLTASKIVNRKCLRLTSDRPYFARAPNMYYCVSLSSLSPPLLRPSSFQALLRSALVLSMPFECCVSIFLFVFSPQLSVCCRTRRSRRRWRPHNASNFSFEWECHSSRHQ